MGLSKSEYCEGIQCEKILWLNDHKREVRVETTKESVLNNGTEVGILAKNLFGEHVNITFDSNLKKMIEETKKYLNNKNIIITEASFEKDGLFCSVDILKKEKDGLYIYEVKSSTEVTDIYLEDLAYQVYVLRLCGYQVKGAYLVHLDNTYVRNGELELDKLFEIVDESEIVFDYQDKIHENIERMLSYRKSLDEPEKELSLSCVKPYDCPYYGYCSRNLPLNNVFDVFNMRNSQKFKLYHEGYITFEDLLTLKLNYKYRQQIEFTLYNKEPYIDKEKIKDFLKTLSYPLYFLDFETFQLAIPEYDGTRPYEQIPFQYSLHYIENEGGELKHCEFLASPNIDPRRSLAESLVRDIPKDVCVLAYNMPFEKGRIKALANMYPDLAEHLMNIYDNIKDLMIPFQNRNFYTKEMKGSYSIKYVLPALFPSDPSLNYHNLEQVHNGSEAMSLYANMGNLSIEEQNILRINLLKYCGLDTYAMVKIWEKLHEVSEKKEEKILKKGNVVYNDKRRRK